MKYELNEPHRTPQWYYEAGKSMAMKQIYMHWAIDSIDKLLEDPERYWSWQARKDMQRERGTLRTAMSRIDEAYRIRCNDLKGHPDLLQSFKDGFMCK